MLFTIITLLFNKKKKTNIYFQQKGPRPFLHVKNIRLVVDIEKNSKNSNPIELLRNLSLVRDNPRAGLFIAYQRIFHKWFQIDGTVVCKTPR